VTTADTEYDGVPWAVPRDGVPWDGVPWDEREEATRVESVVAATAGVPRNTMEKGDGVVVVLVVEEEVVEEEENRRRW
jgi:hypothetical protein